MLKFSMILKQLLSIIVILICTFGFLEWLGRLVLLTEPPLETAWQELDRKYGLAKAAHAKEAPMMLVLGDSIIDFAVYSELLSSRLQEAGLNYQVHNLASPGSTFEINTFLIKTLVQNHQKPSVILLNINPRLFNKNYDTRKNNGLLEKSYIGQCEFQQPQGFKSASCWLKRHSVLVRHRPHFKQILKNITALFQSTPKPLDEYVKTEVSPSGWGPGYTVHTDQAFYQKFDTQTYREGVRSELAPFTFDSNHFQAFYDYTQKLKIPVILVWLPEHPVMEKTYQHYGLSSQRLAEQLVVLSRQHQLSWINLHDVLPETQYYMNPDHLNAAGAVVVTEKLSDVLLKDPLLKSLNPLSTPQATPQTLVNSLKEGTKRIQ